VFGVRDALLQLAGVDRGAVRPDQSGDAGANGQQGAFAEWVAVEAVEPCPQRGVVEVQPRFNWAEAQEVLVVQDFDPGADRCPPGRCRFSDSATDVPDLIVVCGGLGGESEPSHAGGFRGGVVVRLSNDLAPERPQLRQATQPVVVLRVVPVRLRQIDMAHARAGRRGQRDRHRWARRRLWSSRDWCCAALRASALHRSLLSTIELMTLS
jgi:hypothetical protein